MGYIKFLGNHLAVLLCVILVVILIPIPFGVFLVYDGAIAMTLAIIAVVAIVILLITARYFAKKH